MNKPLVCLMVAAAVLLAVDRITPFAVAQSQPLGVTDIKMLAKNGISEDVIISQIRNSHTVYHLSASEILDLKNSGVTEKVIDFMINTPQMNPGGTVVTTAPVATPVPPPVVVAPVEADYGSAPPPVVVEQYVGSPGPGYVWVGGYWQWYGRHWVWMHGAWVVPPRHGAVWVYGRWGHRWGKRPGSMVIGAIDREDFLSHTQPAESREISAT